MEKYKKIILAAVGITVAVGLFFFLRDNSEKAVEVVEDIQTTTVEEATTTGLEIEESIEGKDKG